MQLVTGIVTVVQEGRFRLSSDRGRSLLFTLHHSASIEPQDLPSVLGRARVEVGYTQQRLSLVAHCLRTELRK